MLEIMVIRNKTSYFFRADESKPDSFENNWKNNSQDEINIIKDDKVVYVAKLQTVANYCFGEYETADTVRWGDTVAPGPFILKCFVDPRKFHGEIHAITSTKDVDGQQINHEAMQTTDNGYQTGRWLIHDRYSFKTNKDTNYAWSAGCFILSSKCLEEFNAVLRENGIKKDDEIKGTVIEI